MTRMTQGPGPGPRHRAALAELVDRLAGEDVAWALTGSAGHSLQGVPVDVHDLDVQTDEAGAYRIAGIFSGSVVRPVKWRDSPGIRSHFGELRLRDVRVEIMGDLRKRRPDGSWEEPVDLSAHRVWVDWDGRLVPVLSLEYEWRAYELLGRPERAALLRVHAPRS